MAPSMTFRGAPGLAAAALVGLVACHSVQPRSPKAAEDWSSFGNLENVLRWTPEQQLRGYRNIDRIYPTRPVTASPHPFPLPDKPADFSGLRYTVGAGTFDINAFVSHNHIVGLLAIRDGNVVLERYAQGNTPDTRWYSFSVAKSVVSMLVGAAVKDGFISSVDVPVSNFLPVLRGSAYDDVTLRQAMTMSSGVAWDEDYADPQSDIAQTGGSALDRLRYLLRKQRVAAPGSTFNYNTEETNLVGAVLRAAIGNNLATYLEDKIWRRFGMEHDANWLLLSESGAEHGGCCLSATLRDYGRLGLFALRNGRLTDGSSVLPEGWMAAVDHRFSRQRPLRTALVAPAESCVRRRRHLRPGHLHQSALPPGGRHSQCVAARDRSGFFSASRSVLQRDGKVGRGDRRWRLRRGARLNHHRTSVCVSANAAGAPEVSQ